MIGDLPGFGAVWHNEGSLANILSLAAARKICRVTMDSLQGAAIVVCKHNGDKLKFMESQNGLCCYDANKKKPTNCSFVNSVSKNRSMHTKQQLKNPDLARRVYKLVGRPAHAFFVKVIRKNQLKNCPVTVNNANRAIKIYSPDVDALRGKTTCTTPAHVPSNQLRPLPFELLDAHKNVTTCFNIFFVDGFAFVGTVSRNVHFIMVEHIPSRSIVQHVLPCLTRANNLSKARGFQITVAHADEEFTSLRDPLLQMAIAMNIAATNEHVPKTDPPSAHCISFTAPTCSCKNSSPMPSPSSTCSPMPTASPRL
jgi:hypothetical protein